jgi:Rrf2 family protein
MVNKTSLIAIRTLMLLGQAAPRTCLSPRQLAEALKESPTYMAKVCRLLVRHGILRARKGVKGGVWLERAPKELTLLDVVEACQGAIVGDYCTEAVSLENVCGFHLAAVELHEAIKGVLGRWSLARLLERPRPTGAGADGVPCLMLTPAGEERREAALPTLS